MKISNIKVASHRNGICGEGFHVATFDMREDNKSHKMVGILFEKSGQCAVLDIDMLSANNIEFGNGNSWRGDHFESELRAAIKEKDVIDYSKLLKNIQKNKEVDETKVCPE